MKNLFIAIAALVLSVGCTKTQVATDVNAVACTLEGSVDSLVATEITSQLACTNSSAVLADVSAAVAKTNVCKVATPSPTPALTAGKPPMKDAAGDLVCPPVVAALMSGVLSKIPTAWGCTGGTVSAQAQAAILAACQKAL